MSDNKLTLSELQALYPDQNTRAISPQDLRHIPKSFAGSMLVSATSSDLTLSADDVFVDVDTSSSNVTITLPSVSGSDGTGDTFRSKYFYIHNQGTNDVIVSAQNTETIRDNVSVTIPSTKTIGVISNGSEWIIFDSTDHDLTNTSFGEVSGQIDVLSAGVDLNTSSINILNGEVDVLSAGIDSNTTNIGIINGEIDVLSATVDSISSVNNEVIDDRVSQLLSAGPNIQITYDDFNNAIEISGADVFDFSGQIDVLSAGIDSNTTDINTINGEIDVLSAGIDSNITNIGIINGEIDVLSASIDSNNNTLNGEIDVLSAGIDSNISSIGILNGEVDVLSAGIDSIAGVNGQIDVLSAGIDSNATNIGIINGEIDVLSATVDSISSVNNEIIDDRVAQLLSAGPNIQITYDDFNNAIEISGADAYDFSGEIDVLSASINVLNGEVDVLSASIDSIAGVNGQIDVLSAGIDTNTTNIGIINGEIDVLSATVDAISSVNNEVIDDRVSQLLSAGPNIQITYDDFNNAIEISGADADDFSGQIDVLSAGIDSNTTNINIINGEVDVLSASIDVIGGVDGQIDVLSAGIDSNTTNIGTLNGEVDVLSAAIRTDEEIQDLMSTTLSAGSNVSITYDDFNGAIEISAAGDSGKPTLTKTFTMETPTSAEDVTIFRTDVAITVVEIIAVNTGTSPSTTYQLKHHTDRSNAGNALTSSGTTTSISTGDTASLSDATIPVNSWVWLETTVATGTDVILTIDIRFTED